MLIFALLRGRVFTMSVGAILICDEGGHCIRHLKKRRRVQWGEDDAEDGTELQIEVNLLQWQY